MVVKLDAARNDLASVGPNLRRLRIQRGLSLERLASASGVSRTMIGQIELGRSSPTINLLGKLALALAVPFAALVGEQSRARALVLRGSEGSIVDDGALITRTLSPPRARVELCELTLSGTQHAAALPVGCVRNLVVVRGRVDIVVDRGVHSLATGDAIVFDADAPHTYRNAAAVIARLYQVTSFPP